MLRHSKPENSISGFGQLKQETMRRDLELRLRAVELAGSGRSEIWVHQDDDLVRSPRGERMTCEEAQAQCRAVGKIPIFLSEEEDLLL